LTSDERVHELNRDFLEIDKVTDVLSFPSGEPMPGAPAYLGDIAISVPTAELQAEQGGHGASAELQLLTVHAVLHLLGYDHATEAEMVAMWASQAEILLDMGSEITGPKIS
jgi:probable rRNA maturation factor